MPRPIFRSAASSCRLSGASIPLIGALFRSSASLSRSTFSHTLKTTTAGSWIGPSLCLLAWAIIGVDGMRHAVSVLQCRRPLFKLRRVLEKPIAVRAIQEASREAFGPYSQFPPGSSLYFEVGFTGHESPTGRYADTASYADAAIVVANHSEFGAAAQARPSARGVPAATFRSGSSSVRRVARLRRCLQLVGIVLQILTQRPQHVGTDVAAAPGRQRPSLNRSWS